MKEKHNPLPISRSSRTHIHLGRFFLRKQMKIIIVCGIFCSLVLGDCCGAVQASTHPVDNPTLDPTFTQTATTLPACQLG